MILNNRFVTALAGSFLCLVLFSCKPGSPAASTEAIPFQYDKHRVILLDGTLNGSIPVKIYLNMAGVSDVAVSDSLKQLLGDSADVRIGSFHLKQKVKGATLHPDICRVLGSNLVMLDWRIFDGKAIEISYRDKSLKEITDPAYLGTFRSLRMNLDQQGDTLRWKIPVQATFTGEPQAAEAVINIGFNGALITSAQQLEKWGIATDSVLQNQPRQEADSSLSLCMMAEEIRIGNYPVRDVLLQALTMKGDNIVGNNILDKFIVVFDFKNKLLYLKPQDSGGAIAE